MSYNFINPELVENKSKKDVIIDTISFLKYQQTLGYENVNINSMIELLNILGEQSMKSTCSANNLKCVSYRVVDFDSPEEDYCCYSSPCKFKVTINDDIKKEITNENS